MQLRKNDEITVAVNLRKWCQSISRAWSDLSATCSRKIPRIFPLIFDGQTHFIIRLCAATSPSHTHTAHGGKMVRKGMHKFWISNCVCCCYCCFCCAFCRPPGHARAHFDGDFVNFKNFHRLVRNLPQEFAWGWVVITTRESERTNQNLICRSTCPHKSVVAGQRPPALRDQKVKWLNGVRDYC